MNCVRGYYRDLLKMEEKMSYETLSNSFEEDLDHSSEQWLNLYLEIRIL